MEAHHGPRAFAGRHQHACATALFAVVLLVWFHPLLGGEQLSQAHALYANVPWASEAPAGIADAARSGEGDAAIEYQPIAQVAHDSVRDGHAPLFNPSIYGGAPLLGDMQSALAFPLTWLTLLFGVSGAWGWIALLRLLIAGLGAYALGRRLGAGWGGATLAGLAYMLCAPLVTWVQWPLATEFALFPWLLWATDRLRAEPSAERTAVLGAIVALSVLGGHPETALWSSVLAAAYLVVRERRLARPLAGFVGAHLLGALAAGVALVPFLQAYADSITSSAHGLFAKAHLPISAGVTYLLPEVFGDGKPAYAGPFLTYQLAAGYVGVLVLLLAGLAFVRRRRERMVWALGAVALLALAVVFAIPPVSWIVKALPPFSTGNNLRLLYAVALVLAVGGGLGLEGLLARPLRRDRLLLGAGGALVLAGLYLLLDAAAGELPASSGTVLRAVAAFVVALVLSVAVLWAAGRLGPGRVVAAALVLTVLELAYLQDFNVFLPADQATPPTPRSLAYLRSRPGPFRLSGVWRGLGPPSSLPGSTAGLYGLESVQGYDFPLSERWSNLSQDVLGERGLARELPTKTAPIPTGATLIALRMLGVRYYLAPPGYPSPSPLLRRTYAGADATVFADARALPRAYLVPHTRSMTDAAALAALRRGAVDPQRTALVPPGVTGPPGQGFRTATTRQVDPQHWRVVLPPGAGGWLVFAASWSPLWQATVDGRAVATHPTDYALVGLPVRAGAHTVEMRYAATAAWWGAAATLTGVLGLAALALLGRARRRRRPPSQGS